MSEPEVTSCELTRLFNGNRWSLRASEFKNSWTRLKQAIELFNIGIVLTRTFIGLANNDIKDRAVKAADVSNCLPVYLVVTTNTINVANGARVTVLFPTL